LVFCGHLFGSESKQKGKGKEQRAKGKEQRAKGKEQRAIKKWSCYTLVIYLLYQRIYQRITREYRENNQKPS
jgi:hypothetical protein